MFSRRNHGNIIYTLCFVICRRRIFDAINCIMPHQWRLMCRQHCCKPSRSSKSSEIHKKIMRSCLPHKTCVLHVWGYFTPITQRKIMKLSCFWHHLGGISLMTVGFWALNRTLIVFSRVITYMESHERQNSSSTLDLKMNNNFGRFSVQPHAESETHPLHPILISKSMKNIELHVFSSGNQILWTFMNLKGVCHVEPICRL